MFLLLIDYWLWAFFLSLIFGGVLGFTRAGKLISQGKGHLSPGAAVLATIVTLCVLFSGWALLVVSEATLLGDGIPPLDLSLLLAVGGVVLTTYGSFSGMKLARQLNNKSAPPAAPPAEGT